MHLCPFPGTLTEVRVAGHAAYDRVVFQIKRAMPGWEVRYVNMVHADGSGLRAAGPGRRKRRAARRAARPERPRRARAAEPRPV